MMKACIYLFCIVSLCFACKSKNVKQAGDTGRPVELTYAANLSIVEENGYVVATVRNPWDTTKILQTYVLVPRDQDIPGDLPAGAVVRVPLSKSVIYSSVHCSLLHQFGSLESIAGVCDLQYIRMPEIHENVASGRIADIGNGMDPNIEKIIDLGPDAILLSPFENSGGYGRVEKLGVPIIECADYMETSPLGRAEWMRFYGLLFGKKAVADSLFTSVENEYLALCRLVQNVPSRPTIISEMKSSSAWYVPGGKSTIGILYADAGARYLWADDMHSGSIPLAFEVVFDKGHDADMWLIKYNQQTDKTLSELKDDYAPYAGFRAFKEGNVYGCNTGRVPFYEESPFHPELLLKDLIRMFHPDVLNDSGELRYFEKLRQ